MTDSCAYTAGGHISYMLTSFKSGMRVLSVACTAKVVDAISQVLANVNFSVGVRDLVNHLHGVL